MNTKNPLPITPENSQELLKAYEAEVQRLETIRAGIDKAMMRAEAKLEAARELLGVGRRKRTRRVMRRKRRQNGAPPQPPSPSPQPQPLPPST